MRGTATGVNDESRGRMQKEEALNASHGNKWAPVTVRRAREPCTSLSGLGANARHSWLRSAGRLLNPPHRHSEWPLLYGAREYQLTKQTGLGWIGWDKQDDQQIV